MTLLIVLWTLLGVALLLWSGALWLTHALLQDPQSQVLAWQRALHSLPRDPGWGEAWVAARDALVNAGDSLLILVSAGLTALTAWWPGAAGALDLLLWAAWALGLLAALVVGAVLHAAIAESGRALARGRRAAATAG